MSNPFDLTGRRFIVTGASSGIGRATAIAVSQFGAQVLLVARDEQRLAQTLASLENTGHGIEPYDLANADGIAPWMKTLAQRWGPLSGLVHCAGIEEIAPLRYQSLDRFRQMETINVDSALALLKGFRQKGVCMPKSSVVLISSITGLVGQSGHTAYCTTKGALIALARAAAVELGAEEIRVNCIAPGWVEGTAMTDSAQQRIPEEQVDQIRSLHPCGVGKPSDVAWGAVFLLSGAARWVTGTTLVMDGGYTAQ